MPERPEPNPAHEAFLDPHPISPTRFTPDQSLIGMIHVGALPGTPGGDTSVDLLASAAAEEAKILTDAGFDAIIIENMHDTPYVHGRQGPEIVAAMTRVVLEVESVTPLPLGVQILSGGNTEAVAVAQAATGAFIRCENFVYSHVADEGLLDRAEAGPLLRYRKSIDATSVAIFADIKKKHASHALTADISIADTAHAAEFFGADGVVVTGAWTGAPADIDELRAVRDTVDIPVLVGSGVTETNVGAMLEHAHGVIVGSAIKFEGTWRNPVDPDRAKRIVQAVR